MGLSDIAPTGDGSSLDHGVMPARRQLEEHMPAEKSPGLSSAGEVGAVEVGANPYKIAGSASALSDASNVAMQPPYSGGAAPVGLKAAQHMTGQEHMDRLRQAQVSSTPRAPRGSRTNAGVPIVHPSSPGTFGHVPLRKNPRKK